jgi:hypothetical protein
MSSGVIVGINPTAVRTSAEGAEFRPGTLGTAVASNGAVVKYRYVQYNAGAGSVASVAGRVASVYAAGAAGGAATSPNIVTMDGSDSLPIGVGVLQAVIAASGYGWLQISGVATLSVALVAGADGNALTRVGASADTGDLDVAALVTDHVMATALDASASIVLLHCAA